VFFFSVQCNTVVGYIMMYLLAVAITEQASYRTVAYLLPGTGRLLSSSSSDGS
jgi:hypothetical protein